MADLKTPPDYRAKLRFYYQYLRDLGTSIDRGRSAGQRAVTQQVTVLAESNEAAMAGADKKSSRDDKGDKKRGKRTRSRSRGKGPDGVATAAEADKGVSGAADAGAGAPGKAATAAPTIASNADVSLLTAMMHGIVVGKGAKDPYYNQTYRSQYKGHGGKKSWYTPPQEARGRGRQLRQKSTGRQLTCPRRPCHADGVETITTGSVIKSCSA